MSILKQLAAGCGVDADYVLRVGRTASHRYKRYFINKKTGGRRLICQPARELKLFQYWLLENVFNRLPVHPAAAAYRKGASIRLHAERHLDRNFLLKVDFRDFFPSINSQDVAQLLSKQQIFDKRTEAEDISLVTQLVCRNGALTIGSPTSPLLSNAVMFDFDTFWFDHCLVQRVTYTRYADDIYFSTNTPNALAGIFTELKGDLKQRKSPCLRLNKKKTAFTSRKRRKTITGLVITSENSVSLGRTRKRIIKSLVFHFTLGKLNPDQISSLRGLLAYARSIEPAFIKSLEKKHGTSVQGILQLSPKSRTTSADG